LGVFFSSKDNVNPFGELTNYIEREFREVWEQNSLNIIYVVIIFLKFKIE